MVFSSVSSEPESPPPKPPNMAYTVSSKSHQQPLHNFPLTGLKWANTNSSTTTSNASQHHYHSSRLRNDLPQKSPLHDSSEAVEPKSKIKPVVSSDFSINALSGERSPPVKKITFSECLVDQSSEGKLKPVKSKVVLRLRTNTNKSASEVVVEKVADAVQTQKLVVDDVYEEVPKTWNLRPRKPVKKPSSSTAGGGPAPRTGGPAAVLENKTPMQQGPPELGSENASARAASEKKENKSFSISLSKQEIERDIIQMTGSKPNRRPRKRAKAVQKQLDNIFPGLWLSSITPDVYRVPDTPMKAILKRPADSCAYPNVVIPPQPSSF